MLLLERPKRIVGLKSQDSAEAEPIARSENIGILDDHNGLARAGIAFAVSGTEVVNRGEIGGDHRKGAVPGSVSRARAVGGAGLEVVQRDNADDRRGERGGNLRVGHIGDVLFAVDVEIVNLGAEGVAHLPGGAGENNGLRVNDVDREARRLEPRGDGFGIFGSEAEALLKFGGRQPLVVVRRLGVLLIARELVQLLLFLGGETELQLHVLEAKISGNRPAVIPRVGFRARIALEHDHATGIHSLSDQAARGTSGAALRFGRGAAKEKSEGANRADGEENSSRQKPPPHARDLARKQRPSRLHSTSRGDRNDRYEGGISSTGK